MGITASVGDWFAELNIGTRLTGAFGLVLLCTGVLGGASIYNLAQVNGTSADLATKWLPSVGAIGAARAALLEFRELEVKHAHAADASYRAEYEDKIKEARAQVDAQQAAHARLVAGEEE